MPRRSAAPCPAPVMGVGSRWKRWGSPHLLHLPVILLAASACGADPPSAPVPVPVATITLFPQTDTIYVGEVIHLTAGVLDSSGNVVHERPVNWSLSDTTPVVFTSSAQGAQVEGRHTGTTRVVATIDNAADTTLIGVWTRVAAVLIAPRPAKIVIGDTTQFAVTLTDSAGDTLHGRPVEWAASAEPYEMIRTLGTAQYHVLAGGTTSIRARTEGIQDSIVITLTSDAPLAGLAAGVESGCGFSTSGTLYCWGWNGSGQLGLGSAFDARYWSMRRSSMPRPLRTLASGRHTWCALDDQGAAWCWGFNDSGQLGNSFGVQSCPNGACRGTPERVSGVPAFDSISLGLNHGCGITPAGAAWCWGGNVWGELGRGTADAAQYGAAPVVSPVPFVAISAGDVHTCALEAGGRAWCWGSNYRGELGRGMADAVGHGVPDTVAGGLRFQAISAGLYYTCGLTVSGLASCWGTNEVAQLGLGAPDTLAHSTPTFVVGGAQYSVIVSGYAHSCALGSQGGAVCWGKNEFGELGSPPGARDCHWYSFSYPCSGTPLAVGGGLRFATIRPAENTTCAMASDGVGYCWGNNGSGQLGDQSFTDRSSPVAVAGQP